MHLLIAQRQSFPSQGPLSALKFKPLSMAAFVCTGHHKKLDRNRTFGPRKLFFRKPSKKLLGMLKIGGAMRVILGMSVCECHHIFFSI